MKNRFYKNIAIALKNERPTDKVVKILDNKFAIVKSIYTNGKFSEHSYIMFLDECTVYTFWAYAKVRDRINEILDLPNIERKMWVMDHSKNGKPLHHVHYNQSNRKHKHTARRLLKALEKNNL